MIYLSLSLSAIFSADSLPYRDISASSVTSSSNHLRGGVENNHQLQVEHVTRGGRIIEIAEHRGLRQNQSDWRMRKDGTREPSFKKKKIQASKRTSIRRRTQLHCTDCNTGSDNYPCREIRGGRFSNITSSVLDYAKVEIPDDSVIYCDIPYEDTNVYNKAEGFDYERFYDWCEHQTQPVFISSYQMPDDRFDCIEEFSHRSTLSATANNLVTERIYVPKHQKERGNRVIQLSLF